MSTPATGVQEWQDIPWPQVERDVHTLQRRIYRASQRDDLRRVHRLQRLLLSSWSAKCLAVRRVTQDNRGKNTPGVDGIAALEPEERLLLLSDLSLDARPQPTRRVWIPKPGTDEQRPLGIPTLSDRARQALVKLALEPQWEARFEPNSYGFRPGRSCHDAIDAIFNGIRYKPKYVLDADIAKCFDRINHVALLDKINTFPELRRVIKAWLKAGVLDGETLFPTEEGTPQGGVASPLLANIALHGLEELITNTFPAKRKGNTVIAWKPTVIRYADDFVVLHRDLEVIQRCQEVIQQWLKGMGLELKPSKTRIAHTLESRDGLTGFDFLGFNVRQYPVGKYRTGFDGSGNRLGFITLIKPSKEKVLAHQRRLAEVVSRLKSAPQEALIKGLNPLIKGWSLYYRHAVSGKTFRKVDDVVYHLLRRWVYRRHRNQSAVKVANKYWRMPGWRFTDSKGRALLKHRDTTIRRHVKVKGAKSPYDGDWTYWAGRAGHYPGITLWLAMLLKRQKGCCAHCGNIFLPGDILEVHHCDGKHNNNQKQNLAALHGHCHDAVHRVKGEVISVGGVLDTDRLIEEPYEDERLTYGSEDQPAG